MNIRNVRFLRAQDAADLYWCADSKKVYIRQRCDRNHVVWLTTSKWQGGYEANSPMKAGIDIRIVDENGKVLFEENIVRKDGYDSTVAVKVAPFFDEVIKNEAKRVAKEANLLSYEDWKATLMQTAEKHDFHGYSDNWLYDAEYGKIRPLFCFEYLGVSAYCTVQTATHKVSGQKWQCVEIRDKSKLNVLEICGYKMN